MDKSVSLDMIKSFNKDCHSDSSLKMSRNAATHNEITNLAMDWNEYRKIDHTFSEQISGEMKITNLPKFLIAYFIISSIFSRWDEGI